jgi:hypothetical protein
VSELKLGSRTWRLEEKAPGGLILKIAEAERSGNESAVMAYVLKMLRRLVAEDQRGDFEAFIETDEFDDLSFDDIRDALESTVAGAAARPTGKSASSPSGSRKTPATSKVVRLSRDTSQASSTGGTQQAS